MKRGFTLVELSIVLVIIGLLIGGILVAQSMIGTAKLQRVVRDLAQYDVAVVNFQTKYDQLPGDSNQFNTSGDDNNQIGYASSDEVGNFWSDLSTGNDLKNSSNKSYVPFDPTADTPTADNCPKFNLDQNGPGQGCLTALYEDPSGYGATGATGNYFVYSVVPSGSTIWTGEIDNALRPADGLALDQKMDDGDPKNGKVLATGFIGSGGRSHIAIPCAGAGVYQNLDTNPYMCQMHFLIGSSMGGILN